jgi:hypothetical protein
MRSFSEVMSSPKTMAVIGIILVTSVFFLGMFIESQIFIIPLSSTQVLDHAFQILDVTVAHNSGKMKISSIVNDTSYLGNDPKRLTLIADAITRNFTDPNWHDQQNVQYFCYYPNDSVHFNYCELQGQDDIKSLIQDANANQQNVTYITDKFGHIRQYVWDYGIALNQDPYWIAYQQTGECQELSILFDTVANESGFVTRIVRSDSIGHYWNEVNINGEWKFFDVQEYGDIRSSINSSSNSSLWFGNTSDYANAQNFPLCDMINKGKPPGIYVYDSVNRFNGENRDNAYDPTNSCSSTI